MNEEYRIRTAHMEDLEKITRVEAVCFPEAEAAGYETMKGRLAAYPSHFFVMEQGGEIIGFINGMATEEETIRDEMFADPGLHREDGAWQAVFGLDVLPEYRRQGRAAQLMEHLIADARRAGRKGCILTCKKKLLSYYEKFGYVNCGVSESVHGGAVWYDMRLTF